MVSVTKKNKNVVAPGFFVKDILQIVVGSTLLAIPLAFTQETWDLGSQLPIANILGLVLISFSFISAFIYYNYYVQQGLSKHYPQFIERVLYTYIISFLVVSLILVTIQVAPFLSDPVLALKRIAIVTLPASMSAAIADMIK